MNQNILAEIKKAEKEAETILSSSENKKDEIIQEAHETDIKIQAMREKEIQQQRGKIIFAGMEKINSLKAKVIENGKEKLKELEKNSEKKKEKAMKAIVSHFEESLQ